MIMCRANKVLAICALSLAGAASAQGAPERSGQWICRADQGYFCSPETGCESVRTRVLKIINFENMTVTDFGSDIVEKIVNLKHNTYEFSPESTSFNSGTSSFLILSQKRSTETREMYPFVLVINNDLRTKNYFGECSP